jgi:hypothetical protein
MSTVSTVSNSSTAAYAEQLANAASLKRSLSNLGAAIQEGDLTSASSQLTALVKAHPELTANSSDSSTDASAPINSDFQALTTALANNDTNAAKSAWASITADLNNAGSSTSGNPTTNTAEAVASFNASNTQSMVSALLGGSTSPASALSSVLNTSYPGGSSSLNDLLSDWTTYNSNGTATTSATDSPGTQLDTAV